MQNKKVGIEYSIIDNSVIEKIKQDSSYTEHVESILKEINELENKIRTGEKTLEEAKTEIILLKNKLNVETYHRFNEDIYKKIEEEEWAEETVDLEDVSK